MKIYEKTYLKLAAKSQAIKMDLLPFLLYSRAKDIKKFFFIRFLPSSWSEIIVFAVVIFISFPD